MSKFRPLILILIFFSAGLLIRHLILTPEKGDELYFYCGAGLRPAVSEIVENFEKNSGIRISTNYNASNILLGQIQVTREGDLFMPGDEFYIRKAEEFGLIEESHNAAEFVPVILLQEGNPNNVQSIRDLTMPGLRLGIADERAAAIGRITWLIFEKNDISREEVEKNLVYDSVTVHELATGVTLGHIDAAIVWEPVARGYEDVDIISIPLKENVTVPVPLALLSFSKNPQAAREFIEFMLSEESRNIFIRHHYRIEGEE